VTVDVDSLNTLVTGAIWRAEQLEDRGVESAALAWKEVSLIEEELADALAVSEPEGRIARRGAVGAALSAGDYARAASLAERYSGEEGAPKDLQSALRKMLDEDDRTLAARFRYAAKKHSVHDARDWADHLRKGGAFGLAA
jgi:hypothetical protein